MTLSVPELKRYSRQLMLPGWGLGAQQKLAAARVLVVGAGGLGSACLPYLVSMGVGQMTLLDADRVELSNLHRQILHDTDKVGTLKVESAAARLRAQNPRVNLTLRAERFTAAHAALVQAQDVVVDGSDNFATRYALHDVCLRERKPLVSAALRGWKGQISVFTGHEAGQPCLRCLFPEEPCAEDCQNCDAAGVLPAVVGVLGAMQAQEVVKLLTGLGTPLVGRWLEYDGLSGESRVHALTRDPDCPAHGEATAMAAE